MISCIMVSAFLVVCMVAFFTINIHNIMDGTRVLSVLYVILSLRSAMDAPIFASLQLPNNEFIQGMGIVLMAMGYALFISSVIVRGRYSVSWEMPEDHKLIVTGPYRYIRHPSYMGYFLMFTALSMIWFNLLSFLPLIGIAGYVRVTDIEEHLLMKRFDASYEIYRKKTGRFLPKVFNRRT